MLSVLQGFNADCVCFRYVIDNKPLVSGKKVLDFGAGCGASGLAAKASGASHITFNDIDPGWYLCSFSNFEI